ncbi:uncharacterized protein PHALS_04013 [Plasmopara halstedii]|uniref:Uncharacterized protein n=1 Tax=Plasmopara halstedii TaxID=4781 RepID=A0A0N7L3T4_PLAHL|nr:uncharacterized protein PHALS_04013 [Plasmopara halstedii]CEG36763.1 hypothetical protein PHALS_04013 [Plasmopara halstedii]|eukprot:XP_024573132.1 hypothetical protein PHALS_04013 [Plasmopara halstedii]
MIANRLCKALQKFKELKVIKTDVKPRSLSCANTYGKVGNTKSVVLRSPRAIQRVKFQSQGAGLVRTLNGDPLKFSYACNSLVSRSQGASTTLWDGGDWSLFAKMFSCWRIAWTSAISGDITATAGKIFSRLCISLCDG